ncbi:MAG: hypothetical protein AAGC67_00795 [Myxococcota bacterium]
MTALRLRSTRRLVIVALFATALATGCASTPDSRIEDDQALFDTWPIDVQAKVRAGEIDIGMTEAQVRMALGDPDETSTAIDANGETVTWTWASSRPGLSLGLGGIGIGGVGFGGVGVGTGSKRSLERVVQFRDGEVVSARAFD